jgi:hypothetical protein
MSVPLSLMNIVLLCVWNIYSDFGSVTDMVCHYVVLWTFLHWTSFCLLQECLTKKLFGCKKHH